MQVIQTLYETLVCAWFGSHLAGCLFKLVPVYDCDISILNTVSGTQVPLYRENELLRIYRVFYRTSLQLTVPFIVFLRFFPLFLEGSYLNFLLKACSKTLNYIILNLFGLVPESSSMVGILLNLARVKIEISITTSFLTIGFHKLIHKCLSTTLPCQYHPNAK